MSIFHCLFRWNSSTHHLQLLWFEFNNLFIVYPCLIDNNNNSARNRYLHFQLCCLSLTMNEKMSLIDKIKWINCNARYSNWSKCLLLFRLKQMQTYTDRHWRRNRWLMISFGICKNAPMSVLIIRHNWLVYEINYNR